MQKKKDKIHPDLQLFKKVCETYKLQLSRENFASFKTLLFNLRLLKDSEELDILPDQLDEIGKKFLAADESIRSAINLISGIYAPKTKNGFLLNEVRMGESDALEYLSNASLTLRHYARACKDKHIAVGKGQKDNSLLQGAVYFAAQYWDQNIIFNGNGRQKNKAGFIKDVVMPCWNAKRGIIGLDFAIKKALTGSSNIKKKSRK